MDIRGYNTVKDALAAADIASDITPRFDTATEHVEYVTIEAPEVSPATVLNALGKAGLMAKTAAQLMAKEEAGYLERGPKLEPLFGQPGSITFVDTNNGR